MKKIDEMNHAEIMALTDADVKFMIDYLCAENGIQIIDEPTSPVKPEVTPDQQGYLMEHFISKTREPLEKLRAVIEEIAGSLMEEGYVNGCGYENKKLEPLGEYRLNNAISIKPFKYYTHEHLTESRAQLRAYESSKKEYEKLHEIWKDANEKRDSLAGNIHKEIATHREAESRLASLKEQFKKYLELADGDKEIAWKFFLKAFPLEMNWVYFKIRQAYEVQFRTDEVAPEIEYNEEN